MRRSVDDTDAARLAVDRRRFLATAGSVAGAGALGGCIDLAGDDGSDSPGVGSFDPDVIGSGMAGRDAPGGVPMERMPDLEGTLNLYSGRGEALVGTLIEYIEDRYDGFDVVPRYGGSTDLVNKIATAGSASEADVFYSVNAGSLGALAGEGMTRRLPDDVLEMVPAEFRSDDGAWVGTSGRARTVPYNEDHFDAADVPDDIFAFPEREAFDGVMGWAPGYGSFQAFVTAMRVINGERRTKEWLRGMLDQGIERYPDELLVCRAIADGEIQAGFANHYYVQRVLHTDPEAPIATAFTENDAGSIFNVAGAAVVSTVDDADLAANFVRHLLSAEAQDYFARKTFEYPLVPEVDPVGDLPPIDELQPPENFDLAQLSNLGPTTDLMRDVGITV